MAQAPRYVVTCVHGTFAPESAWTLDGSTFQTKLAAHFGAGELLYTQPRFNWRGRNGHGERIRGGQKLSEFLERIEVTHPSALHVVIAHSHGGNVLLYALKQLGRVPKNLRVVTMGMRWSGKTGQEVG